MTTWTRLNPAENLLTQVYGTSGRLSAAHYTESGYAKQAWPTQESAQARCDRLFARGGMLARPYRCDVCNKWHLGRTP